MFGACARSIQPAELFTPCATGEGANRPAAALSSGSIAFGQSRGRKHTEKAVGLRLTGQAFSVCRAL